MQDHERGLLYVIVFGGLIGLGKLLVSEERITPRIAVGRSILGSATSTVAGVAVMQFPDLPVPAMVGIGSAIGILGAQYLESWLRRRAETLGAK
ncbi:phage holin family protein [Laribacter hongkongensis]|uniref:phage holin family protein n=1 Tax=Laribacter hongkongensis TaxID=168471 RepID=UPI001EFEDE86|nr:phage holin family protein [Laribacter hongkongensis]MCG8990894.1 phage holin family protein [Laribacter hongkongensis]MCG8997038.1 phage holin family protein [Laribacter hongkongensis]MCG9001860.1 phage holin family protein [Laribacter hongkongensis]MCG9003529.1 phage holin family protein [Laribacter hongkongensis]MCG9008172.1 phage holin family protein [Laribacter hongkongensis]